MNERCVYCKQIFDVNDYALSIPRQVGFCHVGCMQENYENYLQGLVERVSDSKENK